MSTFSRNRSEDVFRLLVLVGLAAAWFFAVVVLGPKPPKSRVELSPAVYYHGEGEQFTHDELPTI